MKIPFFLFIIFCTQFAHAYELCTTLAKGTTGNSSFNCADPSRFVDGPGNTKVFPTRKAWAKSNQVIQRIMIQMGSVTRGPMELKPGVTLDELLNLSGEALFAKLHNPGNITDMANLKIKEILIDGENLFDSEPVAVTSESQLDCTYVKKEHRTANLSRFTKGASCLPKEIHICLATIACKNHPVYTTTCKASENGCPSVEECVADDSITTAEERAHIKTLKGKGAAIPQ